MCSILFHFHWFGWDYTPVPPTAVYGGRLMKTPELPDGVEPHSFEDCPECDTGGSLAYQTRSDVLCTECRALFDHEITQSEHRLWRFTHENGIEELVSRE